MLKDFLSENHARIRLFGWFLLLSSFFFNFINKGEVGTTNLYDYLVYVEVILLNLFFVCAIFACISLRICFRLTLKMFFPYVLGAGLWDILFIASQIQS